MLRTFIYFSIAIYKRSDRLRRRAGRISESFFSDSLACRKYTHSQSQREAETFHRSAFHAIRCEENLGTKIFSQRPDSFPLTTRRVAHDFLLGPDSIFLWATKKSRTENKNRVCMRQNLSASV